MSHHCMPKRDEYVSSTNLGRCYNRHVCKWITDEYIPREQFWNVYGRAPGQSYWLVDAPERAQYELIDGVPHWTYTYAYDVDSSD